MKIFWPLTFWQFVVRKYDRTTARFFRLKTAHILFRPVGAVGCRGPPDIGISDNSISTRKDRLEWPPNQYWHSQISEPSNGPAFKEHMLLSSLASAVFWKNPCRLILFSLISILGSFHTYCVSRWFTKKILGVLVAVECFEVFKSLRLKVTQQWLLSQPQGRKAKWTSLHQRHYGAASCSNEA